MDVRIGNEIGIDLGRWFILPGKLFPWSLIKHDMPIYTTYYFVDLNYNPS